ncbi:uncharacterized protein LOC124343574 isoform X2 [Daphnia pulicaria]|uniref:uncharacterized protein LOC124343574 isoform X2 n=1 Tax=Daphnia pulicaria TaxID=35523 RepID=UPI001EEA327D|nr:uncharacterized protein LOC124343574 isoform X2 [Daphnia pulicaria]
MRWSTPGSATTSARTCSTPNCPPWSTTPSNSRASNRCEGSTLASNSRAIEWRLIGDLRPRWWPTPSSPLSRDGHSRPTRLCRISTLPAISSSTCTGQVMSGREWCTLEEWLQCRRPLCPLVVRHDGRVEYPSPTSSSDLSPSSLSNNINNNRPTVGQSTEPPAGIRVCFASRRIGGTFLDDGTSQECAAFSSHPELLSLLPYVESLEDNEAITASGLCTYSIIHDLKNKAVFDAAAAAGQQTATTKATTTTPIQQVTLTQTPMCLIDAEDYSDLPIRQYEEDNVLRELNKAYLGFSQHYPDAAAAGLEQQQPQEQLQQRLPPVGASRDSSPSSRQASTIIDHTISQDWADLTRSTTLVASSGDPSSPRPSLCPSMPSQDLQSHLPGDETDRGRPAAAAAATQPTLLYGGGRNAPLTLAKATVVKQILTQQQQQPAKAKDGLPDLSKLPSSVTARKAGSVYASCHSQDDELNSSTEEFRSANTSLDEDEMRPALINRLQQRHSAGDSNQDGREDNKSRSQSTESDSSPEDRRPESRGFALDSHNEEDSFSGDGLEREKRWLDHFRERRGPRSNSRSVPKDSSSSSKDSSRYSFSTEFSSELDELYDQFSHWLEDPKSGESGQQNGRNAAVFRFAHGLLKRALSDSFASVALNIENLSAHPETRMKDIKLSSSSEIRRGSTQRSWSLNEHVGDERLALQLAREMVEREIPMEEQVLPMPDIVPLLPVDAIEEEETLDPLDQEQPEKSPANQKKKDSLGNSKSKVACQLVSIVLEQRLAEVELELQVPGSSRISSAHHHAARPSLINTRCPGRGCPAPLRTQESVAWEYHQNPSCSFNIRLDRGLAVTATRPAAKCRLAAILGHSANPLGQTATTTTTPTTPLTTTPCCTPSTTSTNQSPLGSAAKSSQHSVERVVLLDRMSPVEREGASNTELLLQGVVGRCCEAISESQSNRSSKADEDSESQTPTPMNPTPPRTRRGSWFFKKSREQRHQNPGGIKHQRARSNSVPTVMELSQLSLWQQQMAEQLKQSLIPDIIVSGENTEEDDECFTPGSNSRQESQQSRRHRSYDDQLQNFAQSSESLLSDDVVEGFSWTMAETIIEDILKEIGSKQTQLSLPSRRNPSGGVGKCGGGGGGQLKMPANKLPGKSILKISSNDSLHRSHSGSLEQPQQESVERPTFAIHKTIAEHMAEQQQQNAPMSWSHRSTSMPSLRAIDELESLNTSSIIDESDAGQMTNGNPRDDEKPFRHVNGGLLPIITGNWGCGSSGGGDAQLKSMLQWLAASRSGAPSLVYYTAGASSVVKLDIVCRVIMDRQWTVGDLAGALLRYCRARLDPRRLDLISRLETHYQAVIAGSSSGVDAAQRHMSLSTSAECPGANPGTDRLLFDELLGQYPLKQTEL